MINERCIHVQKAILDVMCPNVHHMMPNDRNPDTNGIILKTTRRGFEFQCLMFKDALIAAPFSDIKLYKNGDDACRQSGGYPFLIGRIDCGVNRYCDGAAEWMREAYIVLTSKLNFIYACSNHGHLANARLEFRFDSTHAYMALFKNRPPSNRSVGFQSPNILCTH